MRVLLKALLVNVFLQPGYLLSGDVDLFSEGEINLWSGASRTIAIKLRDTYACWSLSSGGNPIRVATQMGHANAQMVNRVCGTGMP